MSKEENEISQKIDENNILANRPKEQITLKMK